MNDVAAIRWVFLLQPLILGAWFPRIPQVQQTIGLSEGALAFALIGMPIGLLIALSFGSKIAERLGSRSLLTLGLGGYVILMPIPAFTTSWLTLFGTLMLAGVAMAIAQLSLNVTASEVEERSDKLIMNGCHGFWSVGVLCGAIIGSFMAGLAVQPGPALVGVAVLSGGPLLYAARAITDFDLKSNDAVGAPTKKPSRQLINIALFGFGAATTEGAMADWLAVFMTNTFSAAPGIAGASYAVFALCLAAGRFSGDSLKARFRVEALAQALVMLALAGLFVAIASPVLWLSFFGVAMIGFGVSIGFPVAVSAASALKDRSSAANVAVLTQITLCGFLVGPPVIGLIAEASNMRIGLAGLVPALLLAFLMAPALKPASRPVLA
ncbi:MFS transporter [Yoonia litorea]|uniref:Fucose permease n=1 Tax=Yoonia litorea TaxID=1123755 RepID=A0A1I6MM39_9RHOB|nr:MFS transporter [Yoonia litorea]SFS16796.1 Fucose permease [Yoonia litorea]